MTSEIHILSSFSKKNKSQKTAYIYFYSLQDGLLSAKSSPHTSLIEKKWKLENKLPHTKETVHIEIETELVFDHIFVVGLDKKNSRESTVRTMVAQAARLTQQMKCTHIVAFISGIEEYADEVAEGIVLGTYNFTQFKSRKELEKITNVSTVTFVISENKPEVEKGVKKGIAAGKSVCLTRDLVNTPASHIHPKTLVDVALAIEKKSRGTVSVKVLDEDDCMRLGMGSFLGVAQGSARKPVFIVMSYKGKGSQKFAFIGKSITFDSGGLSLKPADAMMDMKMDMSGGAAVLGVFSYLADIRPAVGFSEVYGILPACENMPSGRAIKPGDIVTAMNGKTIEVLNTDAEGRLTLADALVYAEKKLKADYIIDMATLTGACMVALGTDLAGLFSNNKLFTSVYERAATEAGDEYWELPLYADYAKQMKSDMADLKNIGGGRYGGAITAAVFLQEFVEKAKWIHIDIAGPAHRDGSPKGVAPKGGTGWGVLSIIRFLEGFKNYEDIKTSSN